VHTLSEKVCARISELPNRDLAAPPDPQAQRRQAHRKPRGRTFIAVDESFDRVAREAERDSDLIANRTAGLSAVAKCQSRSRPSELSLSYPLRIADESQSPFGIAAVLAAFLAVGPRSNGTFCGDRRERHGRFLRRNMARRRRSALVRRFACRTALRKRPLSKDPGGQSHCTKIETAPIAANTVATRAVRSDRVRWRTSPSG
jgi:hypothetical protein